MVSETSSYQRPHNRSGGRMNKLPKQTTLPPKPELAVWSGVSLTKALECMPTFVSQEPVQRKHELGTSVIGSKTVTPSGLKVLEIVEKNHRKLIWLTTCQKRRATPFTLTQMLPGH